MQQNMHGWFRSGRPQGRSHAAWVGLGVLLMLTGCAAPDRAQPGSTRADTLARFGTPTLSAPLPQPTGGERLLYSWQPYGRQVYVVDLDGQGRVVGARQTLTEREFHTIVPGEWTRTEVLRTFGPPGEVGRVREFDGEVWTYRWSDGMAMLYHIYLDRQGVVRRSHPQVELVNDGHDRAE